MTMTRATEMRPTMKPGYAGRSFLRSVARLMASVAERAAFSAASATFSAMGWIAPAALSA